MEFDVGKLANYLNDNSLAEGPLGVDLGDLGVAIAETELLDLLVDLLLADDGIHILVGGVQASVDEGRLIVVKSVEGNLLFYVCF